MAKVKEQLTLTYDDVLIKPSYSENLPSETITETKFSRNISLNIPIVSAAMDTVTEASSAIVLAEEGGIGVIHKNLTAYRQAEEVEKVKKFEAGMILNPVSVDEETTLSYVMDLKNQKKITGVLVVDKNKKLVGILTNRDLQLESNFNQKVKDVMTKKEKLVTADPKISVDEAKKLLHKHRIEKLPLVSSDGLIKGLITVKDILKTITFPNANKDNLGRLRVAAAIGVGDKEFERAKILVEANVDALVVDTAHGHSKGVIEMVRLLKKTFPNVDIVAGNIATAKACKDLIDAGVDAVKVGIGPGSICTTRVVAGIGVPQFSAVLECAEYCLKANIPLIADGGIKLSGDVVKALAAGASSVMIGSLFAGTDEAPGEMVLYQGRAYKVYRGMGSLGAMSLGSKDRYGQAAVEDLGKLVPEGIEGQVPYRGSLSTNIFQLVGGLRSGMGYVGAKNLEELFEKAEFITISNASLKESHPHDVFVTKEAPNYRLS
ncbi:MAG: IMP dehydrogenase [Bacteriovoracaceae bacterium]|nr:IMP dehydrogenase [Bacteriovoracaceae bacterium]